MFSHSVNSKLPYVSPIRCPCSGPNEIGKLWNYRLRGELPLSALDTVPPGSKTNGPRILHFAKLSDLNIGTTQGCSINELYALRYRFPGMFLCSTNIFFPHEHFSFGLVRYGNQLLYCTHPREDPFICTQLSLRDKTKYVRVNFIAEQPILSFPLFEGALVQDQFSEINFNDTYYEDREDLPTVAKYSIEDIYKYIVRNRKAFMLVKSIGFDGKVPFPPKVQHDCFKAKLFFMVYGNQSLPQEAYYYGTEKMTKGPLPLSLAVKQSIQIQLTPLDVQITEIIKRHVFLFDSYLALSILPTCFVGNVARIESNNLWTEDIKYKLIDERNPPKQIKKLKNKSGHVFYVWKGTTLVLPTKQSLAVPKELFHIFNNIRCKLPIVDD